MSLDTQKVTQRYINKDFKMNIEQMKKNLLLALRANQPVMIWGAPGCGKSQGVLQLCEEHKYEFIDIRLSQRDAVDLLGIPFRDPETNRTDWAVPKIWPTENKPTVIMFDEINHGTQSTLSAAFQAIQERQVGEYKFPSEVRFIAAGNRASDRTYANQMPSALRNRFTHITVESSEDDWCKWANQKGLSALITGFIRFSPTSLNEFELHSETREEEKRVQLVKGNNAFATGRSWEAADRLIRQVISHDKNGTEHVDLKAVKQMIIGTVGEEQAAKFLGYAEFYKDLPDLDKLLKNPSNYDVPENSGMQFAICAGLSAKANEKNFKNLVKYILRFPPEFQAMTIKDTLSRDMLLSTTPAFVEWAAENHDIIF